MEIKAVDVSKLPKRLDRTIRKDSCWVKHFRCLKTVSDAHIGEKTKKCVIWPKKEGKLPYLDHIYTSTPTIKQKGGAYFIEDPRVFTTVTATGKPVTAHPV